jgi:phosphate transport system substrate-binding protein
MIKHFKNKILKTVSLSLLFSLLAVNVTHAAGSDPISTVGSSTVYPFATVVAERFGKLTKFQTPVIESTGTGGGMKLFCNGVGYQHPDITNASRPIKKSEKEKCKSNGVTPVEIKVGYDGIVIANSKKGTKLSVTTDQLYRATAKEVWDGSKFIINPYKKWSDIDPSLPDLAIEVMGPPPTSGTRDAYVELVQHKACKKLGIKKKGDDGYKARCSSVREDGGYIEGGENDNLIIQKLVGEPKRYGIFGFSFLDNNLDQLWGTAIDGVEPTFEGIASGDYPVSRGLFFYVKKEHIGMVPGLGEYVRFFASKQMIGETGATVDKGLIPLPDDEYKALIEKINKKL